MKAQFFRVHSLFVSTSSFGFETRLWPRKSLALIDKHSIYISNMSYKPVFQWGLEPPQSHICAVARDSCTPQTLSPALISGGGWRQSAPCVGSPHPRHQLASGWPGWLPAEMAELTRSWCCTVEWPRRVGGRSEQAGTLSQQGSHGRHCCCLLTWCGGAETGHSRRYRSCHRSKTS